MITDGLLIVILNPTDFIIHLFEVCIELHKFALGVCNLLGKGRDTQVTREVPACLALSTQLDKLRVKGRLLFLLPRRSASTALVWSALL